MATAKKLPSGNWRVLIYSHTEKVDGKDVKRYKSFTAPTKKEAEYLAAQWKVGAEQEKKNPHGTLTLEKAFD